MSKNKIKKKAQPLTETAVPVQPEGSAAPPETNIGIIHKITRGYIPYILIAIMGLVLYMNTFNHQFALDDDIVICKNEYVLQGMGGMSDIFSKDLFDSFYKQMNTTAQLSGGRYRPLSVASFAIEQEFIGTRNDANFEKNCWDFNKDGKQDVSEDVTRDGVYNDKDCRTKGFGMRHVNNVIFYILAVCVLFVYLSRIVFKGNRWLALIISLLFLAHPIHTEVVANVKSRDEIFSMLFMILTLILAHRFEVKRDLRSLVLTCLSFFCALLSKEYGATLLLLMPLSFFLFGQKPFSIKDNLGLWVGIASTFLLYYMIRSGIVIGKSNLQDNELLNNPYLLADDTQKLATKLFIFLKYLITLIFPHPLSSDYGYNSIPYKDFSDPLVWLAILALLGMIAGGFIAIRKRHWSAFAIAFYLLTILLVTNLVFNVGATMGERLVFHASLGFCMILGYAIYHLGKRLNSNVVALACLLPVLILYSIKTISRNKAWESDITLALTDVRTMPQSVALNGNAASRCIDLSEMPKNKTREKELVQQSIEYGKKAISLHPGFVNGFLNLGIAYAKLEMYDSSKVCWDKAFKMYPSHPSKKLYYDLLADSYYRKGFNLGGQKKWAEGRDLLQKAVELNPGNAKYWYDLGGFAYNAQDMSKAREAWTRAYQLNPNDPEIQKIQGLIR